MMLLLFLSSDVVRVPEHRVDLRGAREVLNHLHRPSHIAQGPGDLTGGEQGHGLGGLALRGDGVGGLHGDVRRPPPAVQDLFQGVLEEQARAHAVAAHREDLVLGGPRRPRLRGRGALLVTAQHGAQRLGGGRRREGGRGAGVAEQPGQARHRGGVRAGVGGGRATTRVTDGWSRPELHGLGQPHPGHAGRADGGRGPGMGERHTGGDDDVRPVLLDARDHLGGVLGTFLRV